MALDFKDVAAAALAMATTLLPEWIGGKRVGHEWTGERRANGGPGDSWAVNLNTGNWLHGGGDERGLDLVSLYAALHSVDQVAALKVVAAQVGVTDRPSAPVLERAKPPVEPPETIPDDAPPIPDHYKHGAPTAVYNYGTAFRVARYETPDGKEFSPFTWRHGKWVAKGYPEPRPMFGLEVLAARPEAPVMVVEGEKCAQVAAMVMKRYAVVSWSGGSNAVKKTEWRPLQGRDVIIWPDADDAGKKAAASIAEILHGSAAKVRVIAPNGQADGWDIADAVKEGWDAKRISEWAREHLKTVADKVVASAPVVAPVAADSSTAVTQAPTSQSLNVVDSAFISWNSLGLDCNEGGQPHATMANGSLIVQMHPRLAGKVWFDTFRDKVYTTVDGAERQWNDTDDMNVTVFVQQQMKLNKFNGMLMAQAVAHAARVFSRNSLTDWLDGLVWDQVPRLDNWLSDCLGVEKTEYTMAIANNWPISMIARAYVPGCQVDTMPVLEGTQGRGKSKFLEILAGQWFKALPMAFGDKDFLQAIQGAWLIEVPDMTGFSRREHSSILATIAIRRDVYRKSYGRYVEEHPRSAVFAATSETDDYLTDTRGRRRFWPLRCQYVDLDALRAQREQIFAEAVAQYKAGAAWHVMPAQADAEQLDRAPEDIWTDRIMMYCDTMNASHVPITSSRILLDAIEMPLSKQGDGDKKRVARVMRDQGYIQVRDARGRKWKKKGAA